MICGTILRLSVPSMTLSPNTRKFVRGGFRALVSKRNERSNSGFLPRLINAHFKIDLDSCMVNSRVHLCCILSYVFQIKHNQAGGAGSALVNSSAVEDESKEARRHEQADDDSKALSTKTIEMAETSTVFHLGKKPCRQLYQFCGWSYEYPGHSTLTSQEHQTYAAHASNSTPTAFYCPYGCQSSVTPPSCCVGGNCIDKNFDAARSSNDQSSTSLQQPDVVKTAMDTAEKALSSLRHDLGNDRSPNMSNDHVEEETKPETDLSEVLQAWYSAGFYTGK
nr:uncharacterized protein LOC109158666 [Ipomoea batatas]